MLNGLVSNFEMQLKSNFKETTLWCFLKLNCVLDLYSSQINNIKTFSLSLSLSHTHTGTDTFHSAQNSVDPPRYGLAMVNKILRLGLGHDWVNVGGCGVVVGFYYCICCGLLMFEIVFVVIVFVFEWWVQWPMGLWWLVEGEGWIVGFIK
jgi:hypothetical protein